jgi:chromosome segregation ATPase
MLGPGLETAGESIIFFAIGFFLLAALLGVACVPAVHSRAARLTTCRIEAATPSSIKEAQVEKDHLRADFAVSTWRLETTIEDLRGKTCAQVKAMARNSETISCLKNELSARSAEFLALEKHASGFDARKKLLLDQLRARKHEVSRLREALRAAEKSVVEQRLTRQEIGNVITEFSRLVGRKRKEMIAIRNEVDTIRHQAVEIADNFKVGGSRSHVEKIDVKPASAA